MRITAKGSINVETEIRILDDPSGTPETGVVAATPGMSIWYRRDGEARVDLGVMNDLANLNSPHNDKGIKHKGDGYYRVDIPDAAFAAGAAGVSIGGTATGMVVIGNYHQITAVDLNDGVRAGLTALPNAQPATAGGLPTVDAQNFVAGALNLSGEEEAAIALAVWNQPMAGHVDGSQFGGNYATYLVSLVEAIDAASLSAGGIADAVWDELRPGHVVANSFGEVVDAKVSSRAAPLDVTNAILAYDPPTRAEAAADRDLIIAQVDANETLINAVGEAVLTRATPADVSAQILAYDGPTRTELTADKDEIIASVATRATPGDVATQLVAYDGPTRAELAADRDLIITEVNQNETKIDALDDMVASNVNVTLGPLVAVHNPGNRIGSPAALEIFQGEQKTFAISAKDAGGQFVSFTGMTLRFVVHDTNVPSTGVFDVESAGITLSGQADTVALVVVTDTQSSIQPGDYRWLLWDVVAKTALAHGPFIVRPAIFNVA